MAENNGFLELIGNFNPLILIAIGAIMVTGMILRIGNGELPGPPTAWDIFDDDPHDPFPRRNPLADYNPDDTWNTGPARSDRVDGT